MIFKAKMKLAAMVAVLAALIPTALAAILLAQTATEPPPAPVPLPRATRTIAPTAESVPASQPTATPVVHYFNVLVSVDATALNLDALQAALPKNTAASNRSMDDRILADVKQWTDGFVAMGGKQIEMAIETPPGSDDAIVLGQRVAPNGRQITTMTYANRPQPTCAAVLPVVNPGVGDSMVKMLNDQSEAAARSYDGKIGPATQPTLEITRTGRGLSRKMLMPRAVQDAGNIFFTVPESIPDVKAALSNPNLLAALAAGGNAPVRVAFLPAGANIASLPPFMHLSANLFADPIWKDVKWGLVTFFPLDQTATITFKCADANAAIAVENLITAAFADYTNPRAVPGPNPLPRLGNLMQLIPSLKPVAVDDTVTIKIDQEPMDRTILEIFVLRSMDVRTSAFMQPVP